MQRKIGRGKKPAGKRDPTLKEYIQTERPDKARQKGREESLWAEEPKK